MRRSPFVLFSRAIHHFLEQQVAAQFMLHLCIVKKRLISIKVVSHGLVGFLNLKARDYEQSPANSVKDYVEHSLQHGHELQASIAAS
jgi:hypothetical protein